MMEKACRVLIIEDDSALAALLREFLEESGYDIVLHTRGDSALERLGKESFDLILSDIMLPGADGITILNQVTSSSAPDQTLMLLMTGYSGIDDALDAVEKGAYDFVSKPFRLPEIRVRLDNARAYQQLLRRWKTICRKDADRTVDNETRRGCSERDRTDVRAYTRNEAA